MRFLRIIFSLLLLTEVSLLSAAEEILPFYEREHVWPRYLLLRGELLRHVREGNIAEMEAVCRKGLALMPGDPVWYYNLACALAYRETPDAALDALSEAVRLGFNDANQMEIDTDLKRIAKHPRFVELSQKVREGKVLPPAGIPPPATLKLTAGTARILQRANLDWNYDIGFFVARFEFLKGIDESGPALAAAYRGPAKELLRTWLADGTAASNKGDIYVNRDAGHSTLGTKRKDFPLLSELAWEMEAKKANIDRAIPNTLYPRAMVIGNASLAMVATNDTCSLPRFALYDKVAKLRLGNVALGNQFWIFPANKDFDGEGIDRFPVPPANCLTTLGISRSDLPFVRAAAAASAAMTPAVKEWVRTHNLFAPTLQYLFRRSRRGVLSEADYLTAKAHPVAFDRESLDPEALVVLAHGLTTTTIPPAVLPFAQSITVAETDLEREVNLRMTAFPLKMKAVKFTWRVLRGDSSRVKITAKGGTAHMVMNCRGLKERFDIAVFARTATSPWGAPAFISFDPMVRYYPKSVKEGVVTK